MAGTNTSFLYRLYTKKRLQWTLSCSGLQLAKQLDPREDSGVSTFSFWLLAFVCLAREMVSKLMSYLTS